MQELPSMVQIKDEVIFRPMYRHQKEMGIADEELEGTIVAVKFTEAKVFYDVLSLYWGKVFEGVDSSKVRVEEIKVKALPEEATV